MPIPRSMGPSGKTRVSYTGDPFTVSDIARPRPHYEPFARRVKGRLRI